MVGIAPASGDQEHSHGSAWPTGFSGNEAVENGLLADAPGKPLEGVRGILRYVLALMCLGSRGVLFPVSALLVFCNAEFFPPDWILLDSFLDLFRHRLPVYFCLQDGLPIQQPPRRLL